jgi:hypothetical protein
VFTRHRLRLAASVGALATVMAAAAAQPARAAATVTWEQWLHLPGVFDLAGPRSDGRLVAAVHGKLTLIDPTGNVTDFAPQYAAPDGSESYIALSPGLRVDAARCSFARDDLFALDLRATVPGVLRVAADGSVSTLAVIPGASTLGGITFDTTGAFGHRLVVIGTAGQGRTEVATVDCAGNVNPVGVVATALEGGIAVAPPGFGPYAGQLIAANELDGNVYAVSSAGLLSAVAASGVPSGQDTGVESVGFYPVTSATAYVADRGTAGNPHPGTDSVLRLAGAALAAAGVRPGDLLAATEGGDTLVDVRCAGTCASTKVASGPAVAHGEGRLLLVAPGSVNGASGATTATPAVQADSSDHTHALIGTAAAAVVVLAGGVVLWMRRSRLNAT